MYSKFLRMYILSLVPLTKAPLNSILLDLLYLMKRTQKDYVAVFAAHSDFTQRIELCSA